MQFKDFRNNQARNTAGGYREVNKLMDYCSKCGEDTPHRLVKHGVDMQAKCTLCSNPQNV